MLMTIAPPAAGQVSKVVRSVAHILKFRSACVTSGGDMDAEQRRLRLGSEVLISTPGRLLALLQRKEVYLSSVHAMVLDEADVLFSDTSFPLPPIGAACPATAQFVFTTATLPEEVTNQILSEFPDTQVVRGPGLHRIAATVEEVLIDCSCPPGMKWSVEEGFENKKIALIKALDGEAERSVVFCNTIEQCRRVENALQRADRGGRIRKVLPYHGAIDAETREEKFAEFCR